MTWYPMAFLPPQFVDGSGKPYSGAVLKLYAAETNNVIAMATDFTGATTATSFVLNASGYPVSGAAVIIPHVQVNFKSALYPTQAAADADSGAIWTYDDTQIAGSTNTAFFQSFSGDGSTVAFTLSQDLGTDENAIMVFVDNGLTEHSTNGAFATDTAWTKGSGWTIGAGVATATGAISTAISQNAGITVNAGQAYIVTMTITQSAGTLTPSVGGTAGTARSSSGTYTELIICGATQVLAFTGSGFTGTLANVSVHRISSKGMDIYNPSQYTLTDLTLTFGTAPLTGTNNIFVFAPSLFAGNVSALADAAAASATDAATSAMNAATSETNAGTSATAAASSATAAASSATAAATSETNAATSATSASTSATTATTQATNAASSAVLAASTLTGTSTSSNTIGTGAFTFTTQTNKQFQGGQFIVVSSGVNYITGTVTSYNASTGSLVINGTASSGSGTLTSWNISVSGAMGASGSGSGTVTSASVVTAHGVSATVANPTSTPAFTFTLGAITPTTIVASSTIAGSNLSGTNTGDQTITLTGDVTGSGTGSFAATIGANKVTTSTINANAVTAAKLGSGAAAGTVATADGAGNVSYAAAATAGLGTYKDILDVSSVYSNSGGATAAGTYSLSNSSFYVGTTIYGGTANQTPISDIYIAAADFQSVAGLTAKMRLRAQLHTNHTAPNGSFTVSLFPVTRPASGGGTSTILFTLGAAVASVTFSTPVADSSFNGVTADFNIPSDGYYCLGVATTAAAATNSSTQITARLETHYA